MSDESGSVQRLHLDLEGKLREKNVGGVRIDRRVRSLAYVDDMLLATRREVMNDMLDTTKKYLRNKKLTLSKKKTKMLVFNRGKKKKEKWESEEG